MSPNNLGARPSITGGRQSMCGTFIHWLSYTWTDGMGPQSGHFWSLEIKKKVGVEFDIKG